MDLVSASLFVMAGLLPVQQTDDVVSAKSRSAECRDGETVPLKVRISSPTETLLTVVSFPDLVQDVVSKVQLFAHFSTPPMNP